LTAARTIQHHGAGSVNWLLPSLPPTFEAALRDVEARRPEARVQAAERLGFVEPADAPRAREALLRLIDDQSADVRAAAVRALGEHGADAPALALASRLGDADPRVRELATIALSRAGEDHQARLALRRALQSDHPEVRFQAVLSCSDRFPDDAAPDVTPLLHDADPEVRANAARALGACSDALVAAEAEALTHALDDPARRVRHEAAIALARRGAVVATDALADALDDPDAVVDALDVLGDPAHISAADRVAVVGEALLRPLIVKAAVGRALARMGDRRGVTILRRLLRAWRADARDAVVATAGELALVDLAPDLARLVDRPRGVAPETLRAALEALAPASDVARRALARCPPDPTG
jgi:HEAT repeat protein